jgi:hypothetical protein
MSARTSAVQRERALSDSTCAHMPEWQHQGWHHFAPSHSPAPRVCLCWQHFAPSHRRGGGAVAPAELSVLRCSSTSQTTCLYSSRASAHALLTAARTATAGSAPPPEPPCSIPCRAACSSRSLRACAARCCCAAASCSCWIRAASYVHAVCGAASAGPWRERDHQLSQTGAGMWSVCLTPCNRAATATCRGANPACHPSSWRQAVTTTPPSPQPSPIPSAQGRPSHRFGPRWSARRPPRRAARRRPLLRGVPGTHAGAPQPPRGELVGRRGRG